MGMHLFPYYELSSPFNSSESSTESTQQNPASLENIAASSTDLINQQTETKSEETEVQSTKPAEESNVDITSNLKRMNSIIFFIKFLLIILGEEFKPELKIAEPEVRFHF